MTFLNSVSNYLGSSSSYFDKAADHYTSLKEDSKASISNFSDATGHVASSSTLLAAGVAWTGFEYVAGKIISTNAAMQLANLFVGGKITAAAVVTNFAATALVANPVASMALFAGTTILASNPKATFEVIKSTSTGAYNFCNAGLDLAKIVGDLVIGTALSAVEHVNDLNAKAQQVLVEKQEQADQQIILHNIENEIVQGILPTNFEEIFGLGLFDEDSSMSSLGETFDHSACAYM